MIDSFRKKFSFESWFDAWRDALDAQSTIRSLVLEALSDASAEQFLNPLVANSLRHFGGELAARLAPKRVFWVRSEWEKVDLSYGLAEPFKPTTSGWELAWRAGKTGDLGQCEVKVCHTNLRAGRLKTRLKTLAGQLEDRRDRDRAREAPGHTQLRYHGLVWLFQHGGTSDIQGVGRQLEREAAALGLKVRRKFFTPTRADNLGRIWPSADGSTYRCGMSLALMELPRK